MHPLFYLVTFNYWLTGMLLSSFNLLEMELEKKVSECRISKGKRKKRAFKS